TLVAALAVAAVPVPVPAVVGHGRGRDGRGGCGQRDRRHDAGRRGPGGGRGLDGGVLHESCSSWSATPAQETGATPTLPDLRSRNKGHFRKSIPHGTDTGTNASPMEPSDPAGKRKQGGAPNG